MRLNGRSYEEVLKLLETIPNAVVFLGPVEDLVRGRGRLTIIMPKKEMTIMFSRGKVVSVKKKGLF
jgi:hypothetical protein